MSSNWLPPDISSICPEQNAPLTSCSQTGFMFLALVAQLFGNSIDNNAYSKFSNHYSQPGTSALGSSDPVIEKTPLGPIGTSDHGYVAYSHGPEGSRGFSQSSFYLKPDFDFDYENQNHPSFNSEFNFLNRKSYFDADTADSKKIEKTEKKKNGKNRKKRSAPETYDFIIVGAGSAGCVMANRLSEVKKWKVLLLEAGPEEPEVTSVPAFAPTLGRSNIDWQYNTQPEKLTCRALRGQTCAWFSGRVMGGSSAINYMVYMRGNKQDYDDWAALGNHGWSYEEILPYFKKSEDNQDIEAKDKYYHGVGGPLNVERFSYIDKNVVMLVNSFNETGLPLIDFNGQQQIGTMTTQTTSLDGKRVSSNAAFLRPIRRKRSNLIVRTGAQVTKILIEPHKKIAYGVKYVKNGVWYEARAVKEVIISAGSLNSPKILMLSGIGPKHELESLKIPVFKDLKVGYNLQDHATTNAMLMGLTNATSTAVTDKQLMNEVIYYYNSKHRDGPLASTGPVHMSAFIRTELADSKESVPDIQFHFDGRHLKNFYSDPTTYLATNIFPFSFYDSINVRPILLHPKSRGYLKLNKTDPVFGQPLIYPNFFTVKHDIDTLVAAMRFIVRLEDTKAFKENGVKFIKQPIEACSNFKWGTYEYFSCLFYSYTATIFHPAGTCKMGPSEDKDAVVDPRLRVYGIRHLRVADASIMPHIVRGNTNAPVMMIAEKVSDMIKKDWEHYL